MKKVMLIILLLVLVVVVGIWIYLQQPQFAKPQLAQQNYGQYYYEQQFHNPQPRPVVANRKSTLQIFYEFMFTSVADAVPTQPLPTEKTDLLHLDPAQNVIIWMGHSSYFLQLDGLRFLVDPVFSANASPVPYTNRAFSGSNRYQAEDMPSIDYLLISHDHWDHLDYPTLRALQSKVRQVITPIGVSSYLQQWGYQPQQLQEGNWYDSFSPPGVTIHLLPAQHFSGRLLQRNQTLWGSFALVTAQHKVYLSGDSGYGEHFKAIQQRLGNMDVAILECGQYNQDWADIHMLPEQTAQAALDLGAAAVLPAHNSKFKLSHHSWYEPLQRLSKASEGKPYRLLTPEIGQPVLLDDKVQSFMPWWPHGD